MVFNLLVFIASALGLSLSAAFLVKTLIRISIKLHLSEFLVGFILMSFATSLPELTVGLVSAFVGDPLLSLGNVMGANIADLTIVIALPVLLAGGLTFKSILRKEELLYVSLAALAPAVLLLDGNLTRLEGAALFGFFLFYMWDLVFHSKAYHRVLEDHRTRRPLWFELLIFAFGAAVLMGSAVGLVGSAEILATAIGIPTILIGIIIIALGTTLPELSFSLVSAKQEHADLLFGNSMGSIVTNAGLILGLVAMISPITLNGQVAFFSSAVVLVITLLFFTFRLRAGKFTVPDALILLFGYLLFVIFETFSVALR